jgi:hypothetical protein
MFPDILFDEHGTVFVAYSDGSAALHDEYGFDEFCEGIASAQLVRERLGLEDR